MRQSTYSLGEVVHLLGTTIGDDLSVHLDPLVDRMRAGERLSDEDTGRFEGLMTARRLISKHIAELITTSVDG